MVVLLMKKWDLGLVLLLNTMVVAVLFRYPVLDWVRSIAEARGHRYCNAHRVGLPGAGAGGAHGARVPPMTSFPLFKSWFLTRGGRWR